jgi:hypothetical protein
MLNSLRKDVLLSFLCKKCSLTEVQLDTILSSQINGNLKDKISHRDNHDITVGSFVRTLRQAQSNVESSVYTLLLFSYIGLTRPEDLQSLAKLASMISQIKDTPIETNDISRLISAIKEFGETLSGKRKLIV